jgi:sarcosine oxidase / L-pipecolate oxidase
VTYVSDAVSRIDFDESGTSTGVVTESGACIAADKVILCAGAHIPWLLAESAPTRPEVQAGDRLVAAASCMGAFKIPDDQRKKITNAPIIIHSMGEYPGNIPVYSAM